MKSELRVKKIAGTLLIVIFSLLELFFLLGIIIGPSGDSDRMETTFTFIFCMILFSFPLRFGVLLLRKVKSASTPIPPQSNDAAVFVRSTISLPEYITLNLKIGYTSAKWLYINSILLFTFFGAVIYDRPVGFQITVVVMIVMLPLAVYVNSRREYKSTKILNDTATFEFNTAEIKVTAGSFTSGEQWQNLHKIKKTSTFILFYTGQDRAFVVATKSFPPHDLETVKKFAARHRVFME